MRNMSCRMEFNLRKVRRMRSIGKDEGRVADENDNGMFGKKIREGKAEYEVTRWRVCWACRAAVRSWWVLRAPLRPSPRARVVQPLECAMRRSQSPRAPAARWGRPAASSVGRSSRALDRAPSPRQPSLNTKHFYSYRLSTRLSLFQW